MNGGKLNQSLFLSSFFLFLCTFVSLSIIISPPIFLSFQFLIESMDWNNNNNLKQYHEIEENRHGNGPNSFGFIHSNFSVDLKLGQVAVSPKIEPKMRFSASGSSSSKRTRGSVNNGGQTAVFCLVDGCSADLGKCREYHRRHKVCEVHSKTPEVTINGYKRRFCQQCSRFHSLGEFDEGKRSCRKRLDGHNRRRRKPPPETSRPLTFFSPGNRMFPFSTSTTTTTTAAMNQYPTWSEGLRIVDPFSVSSSSSSTRARPQQFHNNNHNVNFSSNQAINIFNESPGKYFYEDGSSQILEINGSNRAHSLLSSPIILSQQQTISEVIGFNVSNNLQHYGGLNNNNIVNNMMRMESSVMLQNGSHVNNYPSTMFQDSSSAETPTHQTFPFYWGMVD